MFAHRALIPFTLALLAAGCSDQVGPSSAVPALVAQRNSGSSIPILQQSATAPALETYHVAFMAHVGQPSLVTVRYEPTAGQVVGDPFLRFEIPRNGLVAGASGIPLRRGDSIAMTLTIDPNSFSVDFQPSGVIFAANAPARLAIWYGNANLDLNGNGILDGNDRALVDQLAIWYQLAPSAAWFKQLSRNDPTQTLVGTELYHFSEYAVSW
jgi:hypothetical protein